MAIGDKPNQNLFGTDYNAEEEERKKAELAAQGAMMGAGNPIPPIEGQNNRLPAYGEILDSRALPPSNKAKFPINAMMGAGNVPAFALGQAPAELPPVANLQPENQEPGYLQSVKEFAKSILNRDQGLFSVDRLGTAADNLLGSAMRNLTPVEELGYTPEPFGKTFTDTFAITRPDGTKFYPDEVTSPGGPTQAPSGASALGATPSATPPVETPSGGAQGQTAALDPTSDEAILANRAQREAQFSIPQGAPGSAQANFATRMATGEALSPQEIQDAQSFAASMGTTFDPATGYSREPFENAQQAQGQVLTAPMPGQSLSQFMRYEDSPVNRTEQFVDAQGSIRRRFTPTAAQLRGEPVGSQPLADQYQSYEGYSAAREARLRANERQPGESQTERDTRIAQSRTTGGQTGGLSFDDARRRAEGDLAARGVKNPSASQVNALARGIQAAEPERLAELETKRASNEARLKTAQATLDRPEFEGKVYTVNGVTFAQTSRGGAQVIDAGTETPQESTAQMKDFVFTLEQIDKAREAFAAGDVDKANDIITAAGIQKNGFDVTASEYFGDATTPVTPADPTVPVTGSGLTQQQEAGIQRVMADNEITREEAIKALKKSGQLK